MSAVNMKNRVRRRARVALLAGGVLAALGLGANAGTAAAEPACTGASITGQGASLQKVAQQTVWAPTFGAEICNKGTLPKVTYNSTGSGAGLVEWNHNGEKGEINTGLSWISTDDAPTAAQIANIESVAGGAKLAVIPITQTAIVPVANPPVGCEVEALTNTDLGAIMEGRLKTWDKIETAEGTCESPITRVVRKDSSGTTYQFKNYLQRVYKKGLFCTTGSTEGKASWAELEEIGLGGKPNIDWPETCPEKTLSTLTRGESNGNGSLVKKINATSGSIGYSGLADAVNNKEGSTLILALQNNGQKKGGEANFGEPIAAGEAANCSGVTYKVPKLASGLSIDWSEVFGARPAVGGEGYPLCTLTYALAFNDYSAAGFTEGQAITTRDYLYEYVVAAAGQEDINSNYYSSLPTSAEKLYDILGAARKAAKTIAF